METKSNYITKKNWYGDGKTWHFHKTSNYSICENYEKSFIIYLDDERLSEHKNLDYGETSLKKAKEIINVKLLRK